MDKKTTRARVLGCSQVLPIASYNDLWNYIHGEIDKQPHCLVCLVLTQ